MQPFSMRFQIRDLEEFSGVKAHTIRMWEKRYGLLIPDRTDTNIRTYGLDQLKAILNVAYLNRQGYKISKIAALSAADRDRLVSEIAAKQLNGSDVLNSMKLAMISFDEILFDSVSTKYRETHGFRKLVEQVYVPLLEQIGLLWQSNSICPAQEHFISNIIRHRLIVASEQLTLGAADKGCTYVLYLPENEIHELGLLYVNYLLRARGDRTIYLGQSVPDADLEQVAAMFTGKVVLVTMLMATPPAPEIPAYLADLRKRLPDERITFWIAGSQLAKLPALQVPTGMSLHPSMAALIQKIDQV
jgi:DNA-binding transcriptional MerR regulator